MQELQQLLAFLGPVIPAAILAGLGTELVKRQPLEKYHESDYFKLAVYLVAIVLSFFITWLFQRLAWFDPGIEYFFIDGLTVAGFAVLGYEGVKRVAELRSGPSSGDK